MLINILYYIGRMVLLMVMCNIMCFVVKLGFIVNVGVCKFVLVILMKLKYFVVNNIFYSKYEY